MQPATSETESKASQWMRLGLGWASRDRATAHKRLQLAVIAWLALPESVRANVYLFVSELRALSDPETISSATEAGFLSFDPMRHTHVPTFRGAGLTAVERERERLTVPAGDVLRRLYSRGGAGVGDTYAEFRGDAPRQPALGLYWKLPRSLVRRQLNGRFESTPLGWAVARLVSEG